MKSLKRKTLTASEAWVLKAILFNLRNYAYSYELMYFFAKEFGHTLFNTKVILNRLIKAKFVKQDEDVKSYKKYYMVTEEGIAYIDKNIEEIDRKIKAYTRKTIMYQRYKGRVIYDVEKELFNITIVFRKLTFETLVTEAHKNHTDIVDYCHDAVLIGAGIKDVGDVNHVEKNEEFALDEFDPSI